MGKFRTRVAVGLVAAVALGATATAIATAGASTGRASAGTTTTSTTTTTLAPPVQGNTQHHVFFSVDTVQGGEARSSSRGRCMFYDEPLPAG